MIHSIKFHDMTEAIEKAKVEAVEADAEYDKAYQKYLEQKREIEEYERNMKLDAQKYPWHNKPRGGYIHEMEERTEPTDWREMVNCPYMAVLDSLNGKEFKFGKGLNVIVGANGSGKTSMLNVMRGVFFSKETYKSQLRGKPYAEIGLPEDFEMFGVADVKADYRRCMFNLVHTRDIRDSNTMFGGMFSFLQKYDGMRQSNGEQGINSMNMLLRMFNNLESEGKDISDPENTRGFEHHVKSVLRKVGKESYSYVIAQKMLAYYDDNHVEDDKFTFVMDEPDMGFDIFRVMQLYKTFSVIADNADTIPCQYIVVLHNVSLISRLMDKEGVNFIELTDGYLDAVKQFV